ncbi:hypothetical protein F4803DRAFT_436921 [Xylaria telfairii]|nr:hypothetical protein F4803DRAFT_436921 [Xylaria telfairii]
MASQTDPQADRVQRKRIQNREAQQKYRKSHRISASFSRGTRVKERMNALERQIKELKAQAKVPEPAFGDAEQQHQQPGHPTPISPSNPFSDFAPSESFHATNWFWEQVPTNKSTANQSLSSSSPDMDIMLTPSSTCNPEPLPLSIPPQTLSEPDIIGDLLLSDDMGVEHRRLQGQANATGHAELRNKLQGQTLEKRLEFLHLCLTSAGFETFDSLVSQYYTSTLSPESIVSSHQRTSRQRDLPILLAELRRYVRTWTQWDAHGYYYEIIKSAESIVSCEKEAATLHSGSVELGDALQQLTTEPDVSLGNGSLLGALQVLMRGFQKINPKLWTLLESLVDSGEPMKSQRQRFCTSLTLMLLLDPPGQVSGTQMVTMLMNCIHMIYDNST